MRIRTALLTVTTCLSTSMLYSSDLKVDLGTQTVPTGTQLHGPVTIELKRVNKLRYQVLIKQENKQVTPIPAVTLDTIHALIPAPAPAPPPAANVKSLGKGWAAVNPAAPDDNALAEIANINTLVARANNALAYVNDATAKIRSLYLASDADLSIGKVAFRNHVQSVYAAAFPSGVDEWPTLMEMSTEDSKLKGVMAAGGLSAPVKAQADTALAALALIGAGTDAFIKEQAALSVLNQAKNEMDSLVPNGCQYSDEAGYNAKSTPCDDLTISEKIECHNLFGGYDVALTLQKYDNIVFGSQPTLPLTSSDTDLGKMTCSPPISFSAGVAFSAIQEQNFEIKPVTTGSGMSAVTTNTFIASSESGFTPLPMGFAHYMILETPNGQLGWHGTVGIGANIRSQNSGGSSPEYLIGSSAAFWRIVYLTGGLHFGSKAVLGNGFQVNEAVPAGVTTVPIEIIRRVSWAFAISFATSPK